MNAVLDQGGYLSEGVVRATVVVEPRPMLPYELARPDSEAQ